MKKQLTLLSLIFCSLWNIAQQPAFKQFGIKDGLPSDKVYYAFQDQQGWMWFGTDRGASRFDGKRFINFTKADGLNDNEVFVIKEDSSGRLWFLTNNGIPGYYKNGTFHIYKYNDEKPYQLTKSLLYDFMEVDENTFLFAYGRGLLKLEVDKKFVEKKSNEHEDRVYITWEKRKGAFYALKKNGIFRMRNNVIAEPLHLFEKTLSFSKTAIDVSDNLLFSGKDGLFYFDPDEGIKLLHSSLDNEIISVKIIDQKVWLGKRRGVFQFDFKNGELLLQDSFLLDKSITSIEKDFENGYWFSTLRHGVFYTSKIKVRSFSKLDACVQCHISFVEGTPNGDLWIGGHHGFLMKMNNEGHFPFKISHPKNNATEMEVNDIFFKDGEVWLINNGPCLKVQQNEFEFAKPVAIHSYLFDESGNILLGGSSGVWRLPWDFFKESFSSTAKSHLSNLPKYLFFDQRTSKLFKDRNGRIWIGTNQGLYFFDKKKVQRFEHDWFSHEIQVTDILEHKDYLLVATAGEGIFLLGQKNFHLRKKDGLASDFCNKLLEDNSGKILIGTSNGISLLDFENNQPIVLPFVDLGISEVNDIYIQSSNFATAPDTVYTATSDGLFVFEKENLLPQPIPPLLFLESIVVNDMPKQHLESLAYDENRLQFNFASISYSSTQSIDYQYLLKGICEGWQVSKNSNIEFTSLPPGEYTLLVKACFKNSDTCSSTVETSFKIFPPFYASWWFRLISFLGIAGLIYSFFKIRILTYNRDVVRELIQLVNARLKREHFVMIKDIRDGSNAKVFIQQIMWIESNRNYLTFHLDKKELTTRLPMKKIEEKLHQQKNNTCLRIHRSYIVNKKHIEAWHSTFVKIGDKTIPIGPNYKKELTALIND